MTDTTPQPGPPGAPPGFLDRQKSGEPSDEDLEYTAITSVAHPNERELAKVKALAAHNRHAASLVRAINSDRALRGAEPLTNPATTSDPEPPGPPRFVLLPDLHVPPLESPHLGLIADHGATLVFGRGGTGKGSYIAWLMIRLVRELDFKVLLIDAERRPYEWKPRIEALGATPDEMAEIGYYTPASGPIWDQIDEIRAELGDFSPDIVIVDSVARACATDISTGDNSVPMRYYEAMDQLAERHLSIAHIGKNNLVEQATGSARWHDDARLTWSMEEKGDARILTNRKNNQGAYLPARSITVAQWTTGIVPLPSIMQESDYSESLADLIERVLTESMSYTEIIEAVNANLEEHQKPHSAESISRTIRRHPQRFEKVGGTTQKPIVARATRTVRTTALESITFTCALCHQQMDQDDATIVDGIRVHRDACPNQE